MLSSSAAVLALMPKPSRSIGEVWVVSSSGPTAASLVSLIWSLEVSARIGKMIDKSRYREGFTRPDRPGRNVRRPPERDRAPPGRRLGQHHHPPRLRRRALRARVLRLRRVLTADSVSLAIAS